MAEQSEQAQRHGGWSGRPRFPALSERLRVARSRKGLSQEALARSIDASLAAVRQWESGRSAPAEEATLRKLAGALDVSAAWLLGLDGESDQPQGERVMVDAAVAALRRAAARLQEIVVPNLATPPDSAEWLSAVAVLPDRVEIMQVEVAEDKEWATKNVLWSSSADGRSS